MLSKICSDLSNVDVNKFPQQAFPRPVAFVNLIRQNILVDKFEEVAQVIFELHYFGMILPSSSKMHLHKHEWLGFLGWSCLDQSTISLALIKN
jgi:hypothetical protein